MGIQNLFIHETPRFVKVNRHVSLTICKWLFQVIIIAFTAFYAFWYDKAYQSFAPVDASFTIKVRGPGYSSLFDENRNGDTTQNADIYDRIWDEVDYNVPPSGTNEFFIMTNAVITQNQMRGRCPEDYTEVPSTLCCKDYIKRFSNNTLSSKEFLEAEQTNESDKLSSRYKTNNTICHVVGNEEQCIKEGIKSHKSHGRETGKCVKGDRETLDEVFACEIRAWCPVELDVLPIPNKPLIVGSENFTVFIKNMISFPLFDMYKYRRDNIPNGMCEYIPEDPSTELCSVFRIGDIVKLAGGNYDKLAMKGGVIGINVEWNCDLDWNFQKYCLPKYHFFLLDESGWNFRYGKFHQENRRTLTKAYGLKFILNASGWGGKFDLTNTIIILGNCYGVLCFVSMLYDFIALSCSTELRSRITEQKYEIVDKPDAVTLLDRYFTRMATLINLRQMKVQDSTHDFNGEMCKNCVMIEQLARSERLI